VALRRALGGVTSHCWITNILAGTAIRRTAFVPIALENPQTGQLDNPRLGRENPLSVDG
jgi:hypothetical protein